MDGWKTSFWDSFLAGAMLVLGRVQVFWFADMNGHDTGHLQWDVHCFFQKRLSSAVHLVFEMT